MIRTYLPRDLETLVAMVKKTDSMQPAAIRERLETRTSLVWEDEGGVRGTACYHKESEGEYNLLVYVDPPYRHRGIGSALCSAALSGISSMGRGRITTRYRLDQGDAQAFFRNRGFAYWYSMDMLRYQGPRMPNASLPAKFRIFPYEDWHYDEFLRVMGESFLPQRSFFDFRPHDVRELHMTPDGRERLLENRDNQFVIVRGDQLEGDDRVVAIAELEGNFIDTLGVDAAFRGLNLGKAMMQHCVNVLLDRGHSVVETSVVLGNIPAWRLYNVLGFGRVQISEWACKWT